MLVINTTLISELIDHFKNTIFFKDKIIYKQKVIITSVRDN